MGYIRNMVGIREMLDAEIITVDIANAKPENTHGCVLFSDRLLLTRCVGVIYLRYQMWTAP